MKKPLKILHVITSLAGGAGAYVVDVARDADPERFEITLAFGPGYPLDPVAHALPIETATLSWTRSLSPFATLKGAIDVHRLIATHKPDILHVHCSLAGVVGRMLGRLHGVPVILFTVHALASRDHQPALKKWLYLLIERFMDRFTDYYIVATRLYGRAVVERKIAAPSKLRVVPLSIPVPPLPTNDDRLAARRALGFQDSVAVIVAAGRMERQKGFEYLIRAMPDILSEKPNARLVILGDGPLQPDLLAIVAELRLEDTVKFAGWRDDARNLMAAADVFCLSSLWESFGYVVLEAMAVQVPIVATKVDGVPEVVDFGSCAELVEPGSPSQLAHAIVKFLNDPAASERIARNGRQRLETCYSGMTMVERLQELYLDVHERTVAKQ